MQDSHLHRVHLTFRNKLGRCLWQVVWFLLYRPTPRAFHAWRCILLKAFGAKIGARVHPYPSARIWAPWNLVMGDDACISEQVDCYCVDKIQIGCHATISQYSFLCAASHDFRDPEFPLVTAPIVIGDHAWVAADVFVGPGVTVGEGSVIAARSSVYRDVKPWAVVVGNPARVVGRREWRVDTDALRR